MEKRTFSKKILSEQASALRLGADAYKDGRKTKERIA